MTSLTVNMFRHGAIVIVAWALSLLPIAMRAQTLDTKNRDGNASPSVVGDVTPRDVLSPDAWRRVDQSVDRALAWLARQQRSDGSFPTIANGQPGVTSLCVMAFLVQGHAPGEGRYGRVIERAADYAIACQKDNGLVALAAPNSRYVTRAVPASAGSTACYNHAISALMLSELYGMSNEPHSRRLREAIALALKATIAIQRFPKVLPENRDGWRYVNDAGPLDSDLSVTGWQLMFMRSARNAGFAVPADRIDGAVAYVRRCYDAQAGLFCYSTNLGARSRGMAGAGILALAHAGQHNSPEAQAAGQWVLAHQFDQYNGVGQGGGWENDRYHYGLFNCCQGMYQLNGRYWQEFFPRVVEALLANQRGDGSWEAESCRRDAQYGNAYTMALAVLSLGASNELLPIFQR